MQAKSKLLVDSHRSQKTMVIINFRRDYTLFSVHEQGSVILQRFYASLSPIKHRSYFYLTDSLVGQKHLKETDFLTK